MGKEGFFKVYRELFEKPIWLNSTSNQRSIFFAILYLANWKPNKWEWCGEEYICRPGEFITSHEKIRKASGRGITIDHVRTALETFQKLGYITIKSPKNKRGGIKVIVNNWGLYQNNENPNETRLNPNTKPEQIPTIEEIEENKNKRKEEDISNSPSFEICKTNSKTSASKNNTQQNEDSSIVEFNDFEFKNEAAYRIREFTEEENKKLIKEILNVFDIEIENFAASDLLLNKIVGELEEQKAKMPQKYVNKDDFETLKKFIRQKGKPEQEQYTMQFIEDFIKEYPHAGEIVLKLHQF